MTVERSQEAVEAADAAYEAFVEDRRKSVHERELDCMAAALAAADAVDPCVPVRVLREWIEHVEFCSAADVDRLAALLDEHANERTDDAS